VALSVAEIGDLVADRLRGRPTRANFRSGALTFCTLHPMRAVPHRLVCLLGLDDDVFPRGAPRDGDDLTLADAALGDRDGAPGGPPAPARRAAQRDRRACRHLQRARRAHERRAPARGPGRRAARAVERTAGRERATGARPATRCSRSTRGRSRRMPPGASTAARWPGRRSLAGPRAPVPVFLDAPLPRATSGDRARRPRALRRIAREVVPAPPPRRRRRPRRRRPARRAHARARRPRALSGSASGCSTPGWPVSKRDAAILAEIARGTLPPGQLASSRCGRSPPRSSAAGLRGVAARRRRPADSLRRPARARRRPPRRRDGARASAATSCGRSASRGCAPKHRLAAWVRLLALTARAAARRLERADVGRAGNGRRCTSRGSARWTRGGAPHSSPR
jgi:exodeoxyribonuclease V gamma subunit